MFENHGYYILRTNHLIFFSTTITYMFETHFEKGPVINVHFWKLPNISIYSKTFDFLQTTGHKIMFTHNPKQNSDVNSR
jgi:hypothetical protein